MSQDEPTVPTHPVQPPAAAPTTANNPPRDPEIFSGLPGEDVEDWLDNYDRVSVYNNWNEASKLARVQFYVSQVAKTWFLNHESDFRDWSSFKDQLRRIFGTPTVRSEVARKKLAERVQHYGESYTSYIEDVLALCRRIDDAMPETDRVRHLLKGIGPTAFNALTANNPSTVSDVISVCQRLDALQSIRLRPDFCENPLANSMELRSIIRAIIREELQAYGSPPCNNAHAQPASTDLRSMIKEEMTAFQSAHHPTAPPCPQPASYAHIAAMQPSPPPVTPPVPVHDHLAPLVARAPNPPYHSAWRAPRPVCYYCGIRGHISRVCRRRQQDERRGYAAFERDEPSRFYHRYADNVFTRRSPSPADFSNTTINTRTSRRRSPSPLRRSVSPLRPVSQLPVQRSEN